MTLMPTPTIPRCGEPGCVIFGRMVGTSLRALCVALLVSFWSTSASAQPAPTGYDCAPGTPIKGKGCSCPKAYQDKRDGEGKAICSPRPMSYTGPANTGGGGSAKYDKLVNQANDQADAYNCAGAQTTYEEALKVNPRGVEAMIGSGNCFARLSKWTNAHMRYDSALKIDPKNESALWGKAEAYRQSYKKDEAIVAYKQYLVYFPDSVKAKAALEKLGVTVGGGGGPTVAAGTCNRSKFPSRSADVCVEVTGTRISLNGTEITGNPTVAEIEGIYGKPTRTWSVKDGVNKVHTWDKLGLIVYEPVDSPAGRAISTTFPFKPMGMDYDPNTNFTGVFKVDGKDLTGSTDLSDAKGRPGASQPYSSTSVVFAKGDFNVFMTGRNGPLDLVELSMWKNPGKRQLAEAPVAGGGGKYKRTSEVKVEVSNGNVTLNGVKISGKPQLQDIVNIYGKYDRIWDQGSGNRVYTWDNLGIVAYEPRDGRCISTTFPYKSLGSDYDPKVFFGGSVSVDGSPITKFSSIAQIKSRPKAGQPYGKDSIVFDWGDVHVFTQDDDNAGGLDLVEVSYWNNDRGGPKTGGNTGTTTSKGPVANAADVRVEVAQDGTVKLQGQTISGKPMLSDIKKIYGDPDRTWDKKGAANRIHTWDNLGLVVYEPFNGRAISLTMPYKATAVSKDFSPTTLFKGRVSLDGRGFYNFNTISTIKDRKGATQPYGDNSVVFDFGDVHVFTTAGKATIEQIDLVEVSFWNKNR